MNTAMNDVWLRMFGWIWIPIILGVWKLSNLNTNWKKWSYRTFFFKFLIGSGPGSALIARVCPYENENDKNCDRRRTLCPPCPGAGRLWCDHIGYCCVLRRSVLMNLMIGGSTTHATAYHPLPITLITHLRLPKHKGLLYKVWPVPSPIELEAMHDF